MPIVMCDNVICHYNFKTQIGKRQCSRHVVHLELGRCIQKEEKHDHGAREVRP